MTTLVPEGTFSFSDDQTPPASDAEMSKILGPGWRFKTYGAQVEILNEKLKPLGQKMEWIPDYKHPRWFRSNNSLHTVGVWTTIRQTVKYLTDRLAATPSRA